LGNLGDEKFVGCGGLGEKLEKLLEPKMEKKIQNKGKKKKEQKVGKKKKKFFYDCPYTLWLKASGARQAEGL